ncbi:ATPase [Methylosinus sp. R-45379]|uniref:SRPBCC family protein n=1 Tax=Methylosinus sp. R-45379 TaxID=980563 RepID=UPI0007C8A9F5|nr:SRPBCC domain-containing protein [Methylosinus sp. R-45379]OAI23739.1 ATPase [Methylosinus sp. R-45379]
MPETRNITTEKDFEHPVDAVWRAMTDSEWLAVWFFPNDIRPEVGHSFTIWSRPIERWDGEFQCKVLEVVPGEKLSFRWKGGHEELKGFGHYMDVTVTWTISALPDGGTHFHFIQEGISTEPTSDALYDIMLKGADSVMRSLAKRIPDLLEHEP